MFCLIRLTFRWVWRIGQRQRYLLCKRPIPGQSLTSYSALCNSRINPSQSQDYIVSTTCFVVVPSSGSCPPATRWPFSNILDALFWPGVRVAILGDLQGWMCLRWMQKKNKKKYKTQTLQTQTSADTSVWPERKGCRWTYFHTHIHIMIKIALLMAGKYKSISVDPQKNSR